MSNGFSRSKGARAEREVVHILGSEFKRTGYAGTSEPDVSSSWALISVKDRETPISLAKSFQELIKLETQGPEKKHFVAVKLPHGVWLIIQRIEQFRDMGCGRR